MNKALTQPEVKSVNKEILAIFLSSRKREMIREPLLSGSVDIRVRTDGDRKIATCIYSCTVRELEQEIQLFKVQDWDSDTSLLLPKTSVPCILLLYFHEGKNGSGDAGG